jgi:hypothetical protein
MIRKFKIRDSFNCKFVFRHRYEYINDKDKYRIEKTNNLERMDHWFMV